LIAESGTFSGIRAPRKKMVWLTDA